jgi:hypothetical protein
MKSTTMRRRTRTRRRRSGRRSTDPTGMAVALALAHAWKTITLYLMAPLVSLWGTLARLIRGFIMAVTAKVGTMERAVVHPDVAAAKGGRAHVGKGADRVAVELAGSSTA